MKHRDYLWCAVNLLLDDEEALAQLCPACRAEAEEGRCPVCGARREDQGTDPNFDLARFREMGGGKA